MTGIRIAASLWSIAPEHREDEAARLARAGLRTWHWDRSDGSMGPVGGFTATEAHALAELTGLGSEAHLMLRSPLAELDEWLAFCEVVIVHVEARDVLEATELITRAGRRAAIAFSPETTLHTQVPPDTDALVMSVAPGHAGSPFLPDSLERVSQLAPIHARVGIDGGVSAALAREAIAAGATWIVSGTAICADPASFMELAR